MMLLLQNTVQVRSELSSMLIIARSRTNSKSGGFKNVDDSKRPKESKQKFTTQHSDKHSWLTIFNILSNHDPFVKTLFG